MGFCDLVCMVLHANGTSLLLQIQAKATEILVVDATCHLEDLTSHQCSIKA